MHARIKLVGQHALHQLAQPHLQHQQGPLILLGLLPQLGCPGSSCSLLLLGSVMQLLCTAQCSSQLHPASKEGINGVLRFLMDNQLMPCTLCALTVISHPVTHISIICFF